MKDAFERREGSFKRYYLVEFVKRLMSCYNNFLNILEDFSIVHCTVHVYTIQYTCISKMAVGNLNK